MMKKVKSTVLIFLFFLVIGKSQDNIRYKTLVSEAENHYKLKEYNQSGLKYADAFVALGFKGMVNDRYNAACSWALANEVDSAFVQLYKIAGKGNYTNLRHISSDKDLTILHNDTRWTEVLSLIKMNKEKAEVNLDKTLVALLDSIYNEDQSYRQELDAIEEKFGKDSKEIQEQWNRISKADESNLVIIKKILDKHGWLGPDVVGAQGSNTLFLVIQHSDLESQQQYLPMMREAVKSGKAKGSSLALLEDRVALRLGKKQIYGSQISRDEPTGKYFISPLEDPDNVDKRRQEVGLGPLSEYVSRWGIVWNADEYKKQFPSIIIEKK